MHAFSSEIGGESIASKYVCVCEWGLALGAYEGWAVLSFTFVNMYSQRHLQRVSLGPEGCC